MPLAGEVQGFATGEEAFEPRRLREQRRDLRRRGDHLLEVVEQE